VVVKDEVAAKKAREAVAALVREIFFLCRLWCLNFSTDQNAQRLAWINFGESYSDANLLILLMLM